MYHKTTKLLNRVVGMQRSDKRKMSLPMKILLWVVGILFLLAIIAVIYVSAKIFITGDKIHNPLNRNHSELRSGKVNLKMVIHLLLHSLA